MSFDNRNNHNSFRVDASRNLFAQVAERLHVLPGSQGLGGGFNDIGIVTNESTQTFSSSPLDQVRRDAEFMAKDVVVNFDSKTSMRAPNRYCKTLRRTVKELSDRHNLVFKGMVNRLKPDETSAFPTFVIVADEIFDDGQVNWGRIVAVYAFAARLSKYYIDNNPQSDSKKLAQYEEKIGLFVGKYVANKLGHWILDHGGWDAFVEYFPDQGAFEDKVWKGLGALALGLGALATVVASR